ncbi:MAG: alpha/beta fold hydrolase [Rhodoglobus sp.]
MSSAPVDVIFFHGAGAGAREADEKLAESLARHLSDDFSITLPDLPEDEDSGDDLWLQAIDAAISRASRPAVLVGHSAGGYMLLKQLALRRPTPAIAGICIIAAPFPGGDQDWTFDGFELPTDLDERLPPDAPITF